MKIAYIISHDITKNDGVTKKIDGQIKEWKKLGHNVRVFCFLKKIGNSILNDVVQFEYCNAMLYRLKLHKEFLSELYIFNPDLIYFRYDTWNRTLNKIFKKYKVVTEINTYDLAEFKLLWVQQKTLKALFRYLAYKYLRKIVLSKVTGIITVTKELADHPDIKCFNKPTVFVPNGINLDEYPTIKSPNTSNRIGLFFIGTPNQPWHGVDIIVKLSKLLPEYDFHIVGIEGENTYNLFWHGYLQKKDYLEILKKCHICIGTLAIYRNDMEEACPLKVREYLAYGYPVIIGYKDTAFLDKQLPLWIKVIDPRNIDIEEVKDFIEKNKDYIILKKEISSLISVSILEKNRLNFLSNI